MQLIFKGDMQMANDDKKPDNGKLTTGIFRLSFPSLFKATTPRNSGADAKPKFSLTMLFPKDTDLRDLRRMAFDAFAKKFGENRDKWPGNFKKLDFKSYVTDSTDGVWPFRDGDSQGYDGYEGMVSIKASSDMRPTVVDNHRQPIIEEKDIYPGCYCRAVVTAYGWENSGKKGVSFGLLAVQKVRDGEPFTRRYDPNDFEDYDDASESESNYGEAVDW